MTSQNRQKRTYTYDHSIDAPSALYAASKQRHATVYDAVAGIYLVPYNPSTHHAMSHTYINLGRVSLKFSKDAAVTATSSRKTSSGHHHLADSVLAPEEALFSRTHAPQRYAEKDIYFAHEDLPDGGRGTLPESDLVKALHGYASHFYEAMGQRHDRNGRIDATRVDERSMDETALLSIGILLEEAARESLGRNGDLVFTEGINDDDDDNDNGDDGDDNDDDVDSEDESASAYRKKQTTTSPRPQSYMPVGFEDDPGFWRRKYSKRRKFKHRED